MDPSKDPVISVVAPAFNEAEGIADVVQKWISVLDERGEPWEIVITDDGSSDGTSQALAGLSDSRVTTLRFEKNRGYGPALSSAIREAKGELIVTIDSDGQFDLNDAGGLIEMLRRENLDMVTGYRRKKEDTFMKVAGDRVLNLLVRLGFGLDLKDTNCALKVLTKDLSTKIRLEAVSFPTPTEMVVKARRADAKIGEHPVEHRARLAGKSKLSALGSGFDFLTFLVYLKLQGLLQSWNIIRKEENG